MTDVVARKRDESGREQILMSYECLGSLQSVVARFGSSISISEFKKSRNGGRARGPESTEWRKELRGDRGYMGKFPGKVYERKGPGDLRSANYRGIIKSIPLFTTSFRRSTDSHSSWCSGMDDDSSSRLTRRFS